MAFSEVFPHPTVKRVIFSATFPEFFGIESAIGSIQTALMGKFPEPKLLFQQSVIFAHGLNPSRTDLAKMKIEPEPVHKIWQFKAEDETTIQVTLNQVTIDSSSHTTYNNAGSEKKFRDTIEFVVKTFLEITGLPLLTRIGLRYIDKCPIPQFNNEVFRKYFNTTLPIDRFPLPSLRELQVVSVVNRSDVVLIFRELLNPQNEPGFLTLDFDGFKERLPSLNYLAATDEVHKVIGDEFQGAVTKEFIEYMNTGVMSEAQ